MDIDDLVTFEAIIRLGSMNKAALELNTVQSNVSTRLRTLETELGVSLLQRHSRGAIATAAGHRVLPLARRMVKLLADARAAAVDEGSPNGALVLGALETTTALRLAPVLTEYTTAYPAVRLSLSTGTTSKLIDQVLESKLDGAFVAGPVNHPELAQEAVFNEELVLVTSPAISSLKELTQLPEVRTVVFQLGCSYRQTLESYLARRGVVSAKPLEFGALDVILSCASAGVGVTLLPRALVESHALARSVVVHSLPARDSFVQTSFIWRKDSCFSSAMTAFLDLARRHYQAQMAAPDAVLIADEERVADTGDYSRRPAVATIDG